MLKTPVCVAFGRPSYGRFLGTIRSTPAYRRRRRRTGDASANSDGETASLSAGTIIESAHAHKQN
jgi:hypothetical protein